MARFAGDSEPMLGSTPEPPVAAAAVPAAGPPSIIALRVAEARLRRAT
jgi:hypothetical protein